MTTRLDVTEVLKKDMLSGRSRYIKNGVLKFNGLRFDFGQPGRIVVHYMHKDMILASMQVHVTLTSSTNEFNFRLVKGTLEIRISDE